MRVSICVRGCWVQAHEEGMRSTTEGVQIAADRVKLLVQQQMNDLRKAIDAKEQVWWQRCASSARHNCPDMQSTLRFATRLSWMTCKTTSWIVYVKWNGTSSTIAMNRYAYSFIGKLSNLMNPPLRLSLHVHSARQDFHARTEQVYRAHAKVQQLLDTASTQAFIADAPGAENMLDRQYCDSDQRW